MQINEIPVTLKELKPTNPDNWLTNGKTYSQLVYLGIGDSPDNWKEITQEEYEKLTTLENV